MGGEGWGKAFDFVERYAWIVAAGIAFVLFIPDQAAQQLGIKPIRNQWQGYLWIGFFVAALLTLAGLWRYADRRLGGWFARRAEEAKKAKTEAARRETLILRLNSLNAGEYGIVIYCLAKRTQTFTAELGNAAAESLCNKKIVSRGSGTVFRVNYHFTDDAWQHLLDHADEFFPEGGRDGPQVRALIENVERSLHPPII